VPSRSRRATASRAGAATDAYGGGVVAGAAAWLAARQPTAAGRAGTRGATLPLRPHHRAFIGLVTPPPPAPTTLTLSRAATSRSTASYDGECADDDGVHAKRDVCVSLAALSCEAEGGDGDGDAACVGVAASPADLSDAEAASLMLRIAQC